MKYQDYLIFDISWHQTPSNFSIFNLDMLTLQHIVFIVFYIFLIKHIKSYIVYIHIGRMLKPLSLPWSHSLITRYVVSPFQVKSQKFLLHLLTILRRFCAIRVLYITVIIIVMCYKVVQPSRLWILQIMVISREILVCISIYYIKTNIWLNVLFSIRLCLKSIHIQVFDWPGYNMKH